MTAGARVFVGAAATAALLTTACVGPATTVAAYRGKAVHAADAALSEVETAVLTTTGMLRGKVLQSYGETVISSSEEAMSSVQGTFDSIQPPDAASSDKLRQRLDTLLTKGSGDVSDLRIAMRREQRTQMSALIPELKKDADLLNAFSQEHGG